MIPIPLPPMPSPSPRHLLAAILALIALCAASAAAAPQLTPAALAALRSLAADPLRATLAFAAIYHAASLLLLPPTPLVIAGGALWGLARGALIVHLISLSADLLAFLIARHLLARPLRARLASPALDRLDRLMHHDGLRVVALLRWCPIVPYSLMNYLLGLTAVPTSTYLWATALATIPNTLALVYLGALASPDTRPADDPRLLILGAVGAAISVVGLTRYARTALADAERAP